MTYRGKRSKTKQEVLEVLRHKILFLELKPGTVISDSELAEELEVSRTSIREALLILQRESLVDIFLQSGTFVSRIDLELVREVVFIRHVLEFEVVMKLLRERKLKLHRSLSGIFIYRNYHY